MKFADLPSAKQEQLRKFDLSLHAWEKHIQQEAKIAHELLKSRKANPEDPVTFSFISATMAYWPAEPDSLCIFRKNPPVAQRRYNCNIVLDEDPFLEKCISHCNAQYEQLSVHPMAGEPHSFLLYDLIEAVSAKPNFDFQFDEILKITEITCEIEITLTFVEEINLTLEARAGWRNN